jgi:hypothetical protein
MYYGMHEEKRIANSITSGLSCLLGLTGFWLFVFEPDRRTGLVFLNWAALFTACPLLSVNRLLMEKTLLAWDVFAGVYLYQYESAVYFFLLPFSVVYAVLNVILERTSGLRIYAITFLAVGGLWLVVFAPYFQNPRYLYTTQDVIHYRAIADALEKLKLAGIDTPNIIQISNETKLYISAERGQTKKLEGDGKEQKIVELLPYLEGDNHVSLILKPLNAARLYLSLFSIVIVVIYLVYSYRYDPPIPAYYDKVMMLMFPYCLLEAIHFYLFSGIVSIRTFLATYGLGQIFSSIVMGLLLAIFLMRLRFISSVEGKYYETRLLEDHRRITRWRDVIDSWFLRQFMNVSDLDRRFVIRGESHEQKEPDKKPKETI